MPSSCLPLRSVILSSLLAAVFVLSTGCLSGSWYRPGREYRSVSAAAYSLSIQKSGRLDVTLSNGEPVFENAYPMVWLDGEREPRILPVDGRWSGREEVNNRLGRGQGMVLERREVTWHLRTYTVQPFFSVQVGYTNTSKKPVRVHMLMPWCIGGQRPGTVQLGPQAAETLVLGYGRDIFDPADAAFLDHGSGAALNHLLAFNGASQRMLMAGFLTADTAYSTVALDRTAKAKENVLDYFQAACVYDPPVTLAPGETLLSEELYLSINEPNAFLALERFGHAITQLNGLTPRQAAAPAYWRIPAESGSGLPSEAAVAEAAAYLSENQPGRWTGLLVASTIPAAQWMDDSSLAAQFARLAAAAEAHGLVAILKSPILAVDGASPFAETHANWLVPVGAEAARSTGTAHLVDPTVEEARAWVEAVGARVRDLGFNGVALNNECHSLFNAAPYRTENRTRVQALRNAVAALRAGLGRDGIVFGDGPEPLMTILADGVAHAGAPAATRTGAMMPLDDVTAAARRYYLSPFLRAPRLGTWPTPADGRMPQATRTALMLDAMLGAGLIAQGRLPMSDEAMALFRLTARRSAMPARPVDILDTESPQIYALPLEPAVGEWHVVGVVNPSTTETARIPLFLGALGLSPDGYYTVYDVWNDRYAGTARRLLDVEVPPQEIRLYGFRPYREEPEMLGMVDALDLGAPQFDVLTWDPESRRYRAAYRALAPGPYRFRVLVPEGWTVQSVVAGTESVQFAQDGRLIRIEAAVREAGPLTLDLTFAP